ncbi:penicillin-binding protein activator LpoB [Chitinispirillales bacterium ANBcel5]|uniref:penicillin-binding protein activator LpoB n=1 Tax=Cellulosispirillum alkaliphilum TaxID=3039283 RepID=UPI002A5832E4|nr:penicillin-binding protein activator LpoB [Chitinispirillales bacterium ANBcel5]
MGKFKALIYLALALIVAGCSTKVSRVDTDSTIDLTGRWNDTDSRLVAEEMIEDCLNQRWLYKWETEGKRPTVIVGNIVNRSHEHINTQTFTRNIERELLNSGRVQFVATREEREQLREERLDQAEHASVQTQQQMGEEYGADLMLIGSINTIVDQEGRRAVIYYQVNMELVEIESNMKVWIGEKQIKKYVERASTKF